eukprot:GHVU01214155.1.p1 GENE.GHVU01214155.1~~GHVU01214155.1.p1  ORF type:complete len:163 (-),score=28.13 GHVU01214155.1:37-525(-)
MAAALERRGPSAIEEDSEATEGAGQVVSRSKRKKVPSVLGRLQAPKRPSTATLSLGAIDDSYGECYPVTDTYNSLTFSESLAELKARGEPLPTKGKGKGAKTAPVKGEEEDKKVKQQREKQKMDTQWKQIEERLEKGTASSLDKIDVKEAKSTKAGSNMEVL